MTPKKKERHTATLEPPIGPTNLWRARGGPASIMLPGVMLPGHMKQMHEDIYGNAELWKPREKKADRKTARSPRRRAKIAMFARRLLTGEIQARMAQRRPSYLEAEMQRRKKEKAIGMMDWQKVLGSAAKNMEAHHR